MIDRIHSRLNDIGNIHEVSRLPTIAVDNRLHAIYHLTSEYSHHARLTIGVLPFSVDVRIAKIPIPHAHVVTQDTHQVVIR